jgi:hypothetical protein
VPKGSERCSSSPTKKRAPVVLYVKEKSNKSVTIGIKSEDLFEYGDVDFSYQVTGVREVSRVKKS